MTDYPPQLSRNLIEYFKKIFGEDEPILLECYKARIMYGCTYPVEIEHTLDQYHSVCWKKVGPPWWVNIMD